MNCIKCPIIEECQANKTVTESDLYEEVGMSIPTDIQPFNKQDCPLIAAIKEIDGNS